MFFVGGHQLFAVHGGIRHLENPAKIPRMIRPVHGSIRHLETQVTNISLSFPVHGGIRHLEIHSWLFGS